MNTQLIGLGLMSENTDNYLLEYCIQGYIRLVQFSILSPLLLAGKFKTGQIQKKINRYVNLKKYLFQTVSGRIIQDGAKV